MATSFCRTWCGQLFPSPVPPGTGWPGDPAVGQTPVARTPTQVRRLAARSASVEQLDARVSVCRVCPRLVRWREDVATGGKRASFADQPYWGRPGPGFGDPEPQILVVGLAPAANGTNRHHAPSPSAGSGGSFRSTGSRLSCGSSYGSRRGTLLDAQIGGLAVAANVLMVQGFVGVFPILGARLDPRHRARLLRTVRRVEDRATARAVRVARVRLARHVRYPRQFERDPRHGILRRCFADDVHRESRLRAVPVGHRPRPAFFPLLAAAVVVVPVFGVALATTDDQSGVWPATGFNAPPTSPGSACSQRSTPSARRRCRRGCCGSAPSPTRSTWCT